MGFKVKHRVISLYSYTNAYEVKRRVNCPFCSCSTRRTIGSSGVRLLKNSRHSSSKFLLHIFVCQVSSHREDKFSRVIPHACVSADFLSHRADAHGTRPLPRSHYPFDWHDLVFCFLWLSVLLIPFMLLSLSTLVITSTNQATLSSAFSQWQIGQSFSKMENIF